MARHKKAQVNFREKIILKSTAVLEIALEG
jgi:hypothetical protein